MKKRTLIILGIITFMAIGNLVAFAYELNDSYRPVNTPSLTKDISDPIQATIFILQMIAGALLYFAAPVATLMIGFGAFDMAIYGAEQEKLEAAKKHLIWASLGLLLIILSYSVVKILITFIAQVADNVN